MTVYSLFASSSGAARASASASALAVFSSRLARFFPAAALVLAACGGGSGPGHGGPAPLAQQQTITFGAAPLLMAGGSATVQATASSGLPLRYGSVTTGVCTVDKNSGLVTAGQQAGVCIIEAIQPGNAVWAGARAQQKLPVSVNPAQTIRFGPAPALAVGHVGTARATASSGLPVRYTSLTPATCSVDGDSGLIAALATGNCTIAANQPGDAQYSAAAQVTLTLVIAAAPVAPTVPGKPEGVTVSAGATLGSVTVSASHVNAGSSPVTGYTVTSSPAGITASSATLPVAVTCPGGSCVGYAFALAATNVVGGGAASAAADLLVDYTVHQIYDEPDYLHIDTEFRGSFTFNASKKTVSALQGDLSEVMAGTDKPGLPWPMDMPLLRLKHQLVSQPDSGGLLVGTFLLPNTLTLSTDPRDNGEPNGWRPDRGNWKYYGYANGSHATPNPGNAYVLVYVNTTDPTLPLASWQIDRLAYADCAEAGMMGDDCMTGTTVAGYGIIGSMRGYPKSQLIKRRAP